MLVERLEELLPKRAWSLPSSRSPSTAATMSFPFPGTKRRSYLEQNAAAAQIELTDDEREGLDAAFPVGAAAGDRYPDMFTVNR